MTAALLIGSGSISKMYTAVAALRLIDRGVIRLTDPIGRWFPALPNVDPTITVARLLQHTSGLADYSEAPNFGAIALADPNRIWTSAELATFIGPPLFPPGTGWNASNTNRLLLGMIVEQETGMSLGAFMRAELYSGRSQTWLTGDGTPPSPLASQWYDDGVRRVDYTTTVFGPALFSARREIQASADDLAEFAERLFGGELLGPATQAAMLTFVPDDGKIAGQTGGGLGTRRFSFLGRTLWGHSGGSNNSAAIILYDPATRVTVAVTVNHYGPAHRQSHFRTAAALLAAAIDVVGRSGVP